MRRTPLTLVLAVLASFALLAGCGASGGSDDASDTTVAETTAPEAPDDTTTTTDDDTDDDEGDDPDPSGSITEADLEAILPTAADVGNGYVLGEDDEAEDDDESDADDTDAAFEEACPALNELEFDGEEVEGPSRTFEVPGDEREISVQLSLDPTVFAEDEIDDLIAAFDECGQVDITDDESGMGISFELAAERSDEFGDYGMQLDLDASFAFFGAPIEIQLRGLIFGLNGVGVFISAASGMDEGESGFELTPVPLDEDVLLEVAALMEERVGAL